MFEIFIDACSLTPSSGGAVYGKIYVKLNGEPFPSSTYHDFVFPVLNWWAGELLSFLYNKETISKDIAYLIFMDSSKAIRLRRHGNIYFCDFGNIKHGDSPDKTLFDGLNSAEVSIASVSKAVVDSYTSTLYISSLKNLDDGNILKLINLQKFGIDYSN